ncbi:MAG: DUF1800 family protein [Bacteroidota bacterium]
MASLSPYQTTLLGTQLAAHLLRRASYVYTKADILQLASKTADQAIDELFTFSPPSLVEPIDYQSGDHWINQGSPPVSASFHLNRYIKGWWMDEAMKSLSVEYKMMFFLHTTFTTSIFDELSQDFWDHQELLRFFVRGSFREYAIKVSLSNLMSDYLDNNVNFGFNPNENYAREFLELFTIGKGPQINPGDYTHFTEDDVINATKVLSGWRKGDRNNPAHQDPDTGLNRNYPVYIYHAHGDKTFSYHFQNATITDAVDANDMYRELTDFVNLVFAQQETARHLARRMYRFFVSSNISTEIETDIIEPLSTVLFDNDYNLEIGLKALLKSQHFFDMDDNFHSDEIIGGLIKPPLDLITNTVSFFQIERPDPVNNSFWHYFQFYHRGMFQDTFENAGFNLFSPESVAGYAAFHQSPNYDKNWFHSGSIIARYKIGDMFLTGFRWTANELIGSKLEAAQFVQNSGYFTNPADATILVEELLEYLFPAPPATDRFNYFLNDIFLNNLSPINWAFEWQSYLNTQDDTNVSIPLKQLFEAVLYAPEYQTF